MFRYAAYALALVLTLAALVALWFDPRWIWAASGFGALALLEPGT